MDTIVERDSGRSESEPEAQKLRRIEREAAMIAKAHADIEAGLGIEHDDMEAWLDSLDHDENAPLPKGAF